MSKDPYYFLKHQVVKANVTYSQSQENTFPKDYLYFQNFYSRPSVYLSSEISKYSDCFDYPRSFLYDEYPDKHIFQYHVDQIIKQIGAPPEEVWLQPLIETLFIQEFLYRRNQK